jgi:hypothetical protein
MLKLNNPQLPSSSQKT